MYPNFKSFLKTHWWFLLLGLVKAINNGDSSEMTGSTILDTLILVGVLLALMFIYWLVRYGRKK